MKGKYLCKNIYVRRERSEAIPNACERSQALPYGKPLTLLRRYRNAYASTQEFAADIVYLILHDYLNFLINREFYVSRYR